MSSFLKKGMKKSKKTNFSSNPKDEFFRITNESMRTSNSLNLKNKILWVRDVRNLPIEIKDSIQDFLNKKNIHHGDCHLNSIKLSVFNPKINRVCGFIGKKFGDMEQNFLQNNMNLILNPNGFYETNIGIDGNMDTTFYDMENKIIYIQHSWNEYDGIHFDITEFCSNEMMRYKNELIPKYNLENDIEGKLDKNWRYYYQSFKVDIKKIKSRSMNVKSVLEKVIETYPKFGIIMNRLLYYPKKNSFIWSEKVENYILI